ncbi:MAG: NAD-dependent epimerase/dehydratase family protein [Hyphomonadaceae bacterium]|nr:NAD-dependent epimerase/dehydratase family protein [Hyphomonadaceae bacterium]
MRIFVTGASGFVGGAATRKFVAGGHQVRAMSRSEKSDAAIAALGAAPVRCDLEDVTAAHVGDSEAIVHCAAFVEQWGPVDAWKRFNIDGTERMLAASREAGALRFIHISTESVLWRGQHLRDVDETYPRAPNSPYPYSWTKARAEELVERANGAEFQTIILRPRFIWGPGDTTLLPTLRAMAASGQWMWIDGGRARTSTTHIDNLIHAIELALTKGRGGEAYFVLDDGVRTLREMIGAIAGSQGISLPDREIPAWAADVAGATAEIVWRLFGLRSEPPLTRFSAMIMSREAVLRDGKARAELGYAPVIGVEEGLARMRQA